MNYVGNQAEWITDKLMTHLSSSDGDSVAIWNPDRWHGHPLMDNIRVKGLNWFGDTIPQQYFHVFNQRTKVLENFNFILPNLPVVKKNVVWWFVKLKPGELQLMHYDMHVLGVAHENNEFTKVTGTFPVNDVIRYTMFLQDWEPGHVFVYEDKVNPIYKKGDIFEWSDPELLHGVVNLSFNPRYTLQITTHD
jgi:hypothetical protein